MYMFEPGSLLPPLSGLSVIVIEVWFTPRMYGHLGRLDISPESDSVGVEPTKTSQ